MSEQKPPSAGTDGPPVPRDLPDQQATDQRDPWEPEDDAAHSGDAPDADDDVPDTDEAGTGRRGAPHAHGPGPDRPVPDEPSG